ncbi:uncharacterized protein LOC126896675 [Daktulosphaira vitifoliae]|uniref:uncharacterized protein LOC126896675 n=1 Tax=Daktulosphaira vitifoliae TaxID=58002 RepID=UPI0021A9A104|nr:uncharacterized protein LOC126896675 [Daktulosphaira vitifoliae]XP_050525589.1 uncharacterized protein LOC126896675 [Daktulosphaira vitifoliae]
MDCRGDELIQHNNRTPAAQAVPFQYLINEQAKSILALQELQNEVGALLEFRDLVMDTFPHLRQKQLSSPEPSSGSQGVGSGESRWEPGVRVRRKLGSTSSQSSGWIAGGGLTTVPRSRSNSHGKGPKSGEPTTTTSVGTVQDSGFCTESKDSSSTSSRKNKDEDELWSLLELIQDKGIKLKLDVEFLQDRLLKSTSRNDLQLRKCKSLVDLTRVQQSPTFVDDYNVFHSHVTQLKEERDSLLDRVTEMEAESLSNAAQIHRLLAELKAVVCENKELEERLSGSGKQSKLVRNSSHNGGFTPVQPESTDQSSSGTRDAYYTLSQHSTNLSSIELCKQCSYETDDRSRQLVEMVRPSDPISRNLDGCRSPVYPTVSSPTYAKRLGTLDGIVSSPADKLNRSTGGTPLPKQTLAAILKTFNPIELQRHLITISYENKNLVRQIESLSKSKDDVSNELHRSKEDNEELKFQLEEKQIELEGTMARVRLLQLHQEQQQHLSPQKTSSHTSPSLNTPGNTSTTAATITSSRNSVTKSQWLDLLPSNPILPQLALPATPSMHQNHIQQNEENNSSTESAHQARSKQHHSQPSKIPIKAFSSPRPPSSYREPRDPYPSWNKSKSDQSLPRNLDSIKITNGRSSGEVHQNSIGSGKYQRRQDSLQDSRRGRRDSSVGGGGGMARTKSQQRSNSIKEKVTTVGSQTADDTKKRHQPLFRRRNLVRQNRILEKTAVLLPALDEVQEPPESLVDNNVSIEFFDSIESSVATSASSRRQQLVDCDSIDLSQPDLSVT